MVINLSASVKEKADDIGTAIIKLLKATSVQYAVSYQNSVILSGSVGKYDQKESRPLSNNDLYGIGSTSKMYVTAAVLLLAKRKLLEIDRPYSEYVPEFYMADERYSAITVRHLLNHSSGIYGTHFKGSFMLEESNTYAHDTLLNSLKSEKLKYAPGLFSEYCNDGFQLLEILVERISGLPYNEFLKLNFFLPLELANTVTPQDDYDLTRMARYAMPEIFEGDLPYEVVNLIGTGGIVSTAEDLCRFARVLMGKEILSPESARAMAAREYETGAFWPLDEEANNLFAYGLGYDHVHVPPFDKVGLQALCKGGDTTQYHASLILIPELDLAAAVLSAGGASFANYCLAVELLQGACLELGLVTKFPPQATFEEPLAQPVPDVLKEFPGLYAERGKTVDIEITDDAIELKALLDGLIPAQKYVYAGSGRFVSPDGKCALHFVESGEGTTFLQGDMLIELPGIGNVRWKAFLYQKLERNALPEKLTEIWQARGDKKYIVVDDLVRSGNYLSFREPSLVKFPVNVDYGYAAGGAGIIGEDYAENVLYFRDVADYRFFREGETEYLSSKGFVFMDTATIPDLNSPIEAVTIGEKGHTEFFYVGELLDGKTVSVEVPQNAVFGAYEEKSTSEEKDAEPKLFPKLLTTLTGIRSVELRQGDLLAFGGQVGSKIKMSWQ